MTDYPQYPTGPSPYGGAPPPPARGPRPPSVDLAVKLIWVMIAISLISAVYTFANLDSIVDQALEDAGVSETVDPDLVRSGAVIGAVIGLVISVGLYALLAVFIAKGASWARIVYTVLAALGIVFSVLGFLSGGAATAGPVLLTILGLVSWALTVVVLLLLWKQESTAWFKARPGDPPVA